MTMCNGYRRMPDRVLDWVPLEVSHKGQLHELHKLIQEEQGEVDCYV